MQEKFSPHAWIRARERYPEVDPADIALVPQRIEDTIRRHLNGLDPAERDGRCFVSVYLPTRSGKRVKAKFIYAHIDRVVVTTLPFLGRYDREFPLRFTVGAAEREWHHLPKLAFWGS